MFLDLNFESSEYWKFRTFAHADIYAISEGRISKIKSLNSHIESIIDNKNQLIQRLQQPFQGDFIKLEAQYHRWLDYYTDLVAINLPSRFST